MLTTRTAEYKNDDGKYLPALLLEGPGNNTLILDEVGYAATLGLSGA